MIEHRGDITNALVHLTKPSNGLTALEVLCKILNDGLLIGSGKDGYVKGPSRAVCFTETPLSALKHFASNEIGLGGAKYCFYGIAINKKAAFEQGARPVIYLPDEESKWIPEEERWRHVRYEYGRVDWTYEREWRRRGDFDITLPPGIYIICWQAFEISIIERAMSRCVAKKVRGYLPMMHLNQML